MKRVTVEDVKKLKGKEPFAMLTAYDYAGGRLVDEAGLPVVLVGDSLGMVVLGYDSTIPVTLDEMLHHTRAVARGVQRALVVGDMPFMTYHLSAEQALQNAGRFLQEAGAQAVKLEGGVTVADKVRRLVDCGIPVMGHIGLTPQSVHQLGGYRTQGKTPAAAARLIEDARALEAAGAFSVVLECVPDLLAKLITERIGIPTIGIGAGPHCDGQVQVFHDLLGLTSGYLPKHARRYADLQGIISEALRRYAEEVRGRTFPAQAESFGAGDALRAELEGLGAAEERGAIRIGRDDPLQAEVLGAPEDAIYDEATPLYHYTATG